jgi:hypothetical protein
MQVCQRSFGFLNKTETPSWIEISALARVLGRAFPNPPWLALFAIRRLEIFQDYLSC